MARIGSLAAWEQRLAAQRRDEDRLAREHRQREKDTERLRQQEHLAERQRAAAEQTAEVEGRMKALGEVLTGVLPLRPLTFERLLAASREHRFDPGPLGSALPAPDWDDFAPVPAVGFGRLLGPSARQAAVNEARARFEAAQAELAAAPTASSHGLAWAAPGIWSGSITLPLRYRPCPTGSASANRTVPGRVAVASRRVSACSSDRAPSANPRSLISRWPCPANRATAGTGGTPSPSRRTPTCSPSGGGACGSGR
jgi:hypothetical protein